MAKKYGEDDLLKCAKRFIAAVHAKDAEGMLEELDQLLSYYEEDSEGEGEHAGRPVVGLLMGK